MNAAVLLSLVQLAAPAKPQTLTELKPMDPVTVTAGKVSREQILGEDEPLRLLLDGEKILYKRDGNLEFAYLAPALGEAGDDGLLMAVTSDDPTKSDCTKYLWVLVHKDGTASATDEFGDCSERFKIERVKDAVTTTFSDKNLAWTLQDGKVTAVAGKKSGGKKKK
ncbi:MAG: hypothetical protein JST54_28250 [Deltaproteobacteria bacterium]|nr:hypothetical protein [Deltaproteobacteria bacterium]